MTDGPPLDRARIVETLDRHGVEYLVVGGVGAQLHGATRPTADFDSVPATSEANLGRLAAALRELNAYLRVGGLTDDEARELPMQIDAASLARLDVSTWRTDAGDLDVLVHLRDRAGRLVPYDEMIGRARAVRLEGVVVTLASLDDIIASKEFADRPKDREALDELRRLAEKQR